MPNTIKNALQGAVEHLIRAGAYVSARASEASTWAGIVSIITGAAALTAPYSYLVIAAGIVGVFAKTKPEALSQ